MAPPNGEGSGQHAEPFRLRHHYHPTQEQTRIVASERAMALLTTPLIILRCRHRRGCQHAATARRHSDGDQEPGAFSPAPRPMRVELERGGPTATVTKPPRKSTSCHRHRVVSARDPHHCRMPARSFGAGFRRVMRASVDTGNGQRSIQRHLIRSYLPTLILVEGV